MGRGNICTHYKYEGLYYLDSDFLNAFYKVERCKCCGKPIDRNDECETKTAKELDQEGIEYAYNNEEETEWIWDEDQSKINWKDMIEIIQNDIKKKHPSFNITDRWRGSIYGSSDRNFHVVLENEWFDIAVADNESNAAWCLLQRRNEDPDENEEKQMEIDSQIYLETIKRTLIEYWGEAITYGGPWVHGKRYTGKDIA